MPKLAQMATVTTTTEVVLKPQLRKKLQLKLQEYAKLAAEKKALKTRIDKLTKELGDLRNETGEMSVSLEGYGAVTLVAGTYKKFNEKRYVQLGGELALYQQALEDKPKKSYEKVTVPGAESDDE